MGMLYREGLLKPDEFQGTCHLRNAVPEVVPVAVEPVAVEPEAVDSEAVVVSEEVEHDSFESCSTSPDSFESCSTSPDPALASTPKTAVRTESK
jgi:hypothetical protein